MIKLGKHITDEMTVRNILLAYIEVAIALPDRTPPDPKDAGLTRSYKSIPAFGGRILRVVHRPDGADVFVVTAHWDKGARKT